MMLILSAFVLCASSLPPHLDYVLKCPTLSLLGSSDIFNSFILENVETDSPDALLGLLISCYVVGFTISAFYFGNAVHHYKPFQLCTLGMSIWCVAVFFSGIAFYAKSFVMLCIFRICTGIGEASYVAAIPVWIQRYAGSYSDGTSRAGLWLSIYNTTIPVGLAVGYVYGSAISESIGWQWAFLIESFVVAPLTLYLGLRCAHVYGKEIDCVREEEILLLKENGNHEQTTYKTNPRIWDEVKICMSSPVYVCASLATAAQSGMLTGIAAFGAAFLLGFDYFDNPSSCATFFGITISVAALIGTPCGGYHLDRVLIKGSASSSSEDSASWHENQYQNLATVNWFLFWTSVIASVCLTLLYPIDNKYLFFFVLIVALIFSFTQNTANTISQMVAVGPEHKAYGLALGGIISRVLGDVPAPILVGYLKDQLAPGCIGDDDRVSTTAGCRHDGNGLRETLLFASTWNIWAILLGFVAWYWSKEALKTWSDVVSFFMNGRKMEPQKDTTTGTSIELRETKNPLPELASDSAL
jgi:MFS family permease